MPNSSARLQLSLTGQVVPVSPISGNPVVGVSGLITDLTVIGTGLPIAKLTVPLGVGDTAVMANTPPSKVAGQAPNTAATGFLFLCVRDSSGSTPVGHVVLTEPGLGEVRRLAVGGVYLYIPNGAAGAAVSDQAWDVTFSGDAAAIRAEVYFLG